MVKRLAFRKKVLVSALTASLLTPAFAAEIQLEADGGWTAFDRGTHANVTVGDGEISVRGDFDENESIRIRWGEVAEDVYPDVDEVSGLVRFENVAVGAQSRLTIDLVGSTEFSHSKGYWVGAVWEPNHENPEAGARVDMHIDMQTIASWGSASAVELGNVGVLTQDIGNALGSADERFYATLLIKDPLRLDADSRFALGASLEEAQNQGVNLLVGEHGCLAIDLSRLSEDRSMIDVAEGATIAFRKNSVVLLEDLRELTDEGESLALEEAEINRLMGRLINRAEAVTGLSNASVVNVSQAWEGYFDVDASGALTIRKGKWEADGRLAAPVNALHEQWRQSERAGALNEFFTANPISAWAEEAMESTTRLQTALGSTLAMDEAAFGGNRFARGALRQDAARLPIAFDIIGGRIEGEAMDFPGSVGRFERETEGAAFSIRGQTKEWLWGARLLYEDANIDYESNYVNPDSLKTDSTLLAGSVYLGKTFGRQTVLVDLTVIGVEDQMKFFQREGLLIGSDDISRQSFSLGLTGIWKPFEEGLRGWQTSLVGSLQLADYLKTEYDVGMGDETLWTVEEPDRWVASAALGVELQRSWHRFTRVEEKDGEWRTRDDWVELGLQGGMRMRTGDLESEQLVRVGSSEARLDADQLGQWEAYAGLRLDASWKDAFMGLAAEGLWGPDGRETLRLQANVVWYWD